MVSNRNSQLPDFLRVLRCFVINKEGAILILRRAENDRYSSGAWEIPGGKLDRGESPVDALMREVREETGLAVKLREKRPDFQHLRRIIEGPRIGDTYWSSFYMGYVNNDSVLLSEEHSEYAWVNLAEMATYELTNDVRMAMSAQLNYLQECLSTPSS